MTLAIARLVVCTILVASASLSVSAQARRPPAQPARPARPAPRPPAPAPPPPRVPPDLRVVSRYTTGEVTTDSTALFKGQRARLQLGADLASLQQCDLQRTVQLNSRTRVYLPSPFETAPPPRPADDDEKKEKAKGGLVTYTTTVTDTGETQQMHGFTARHLRSVTVRASSTDACDRSQQQTETDGWYIDIPQSLSCVTVPQPERRLIAHAEKTECVDEVTYERSGPALGLPLRYTTVSTSGTDAPVTTVMEVTELARVDVPADSVELPGDYLEVRTVRQLTADHRPGEAGARRPGVVRVGVAPVSNRSDMTIATEELGEALLESLSESEYDVMRLRGSTPDELLADARSKDVDFILQNTVAEVKVPRGGVVGRLTGSANEAFTAKVDFALVPPGQARPAYSSSERSGGSTLNRAITVTRKLVMFATPVLLGRYQYLNAYGGALNQGAGASGGMGQTGDPIMNTAFALLDRATSKTAPSEQYQDQDSAVAAAMEKEVRAVLGELGKRKR